jgi:hypothetical protein
MWGYRNFFVMMSGLSQHVRGSSRKKEHEWFGEFDDDITIC